MTNVCPLDHKQSVSNPCGIVDCPFYYSHQQESGCVLKAMHNLEEVSDRIAFLTERGLSTPARIHRQFEDLGLAVKDFDSLPVNFAAPPTACPDCGYPKMCNSEALCDDRREALNHASIDLEGLVSRYQIWEAVISKKDSFLPRRLSASLRDLVSTI